MFFFSLNSPETNGIISTENIDETLNNESKSNTLPTTTYTIPSKTGKISTQSLLTTSSSTTNSNEQSSSNSLSWLHRLSSRFNSSTSIPRTTITKTSSTGLIFENRPTNLPPKSDKETLKHQVEYQKMCLEAKRAQQLFDEKEEQRQKLKHKREEFVSKSLKIWTNDILPHWDKYGGMHNCPDLTLNSKAYKLWWHGLPPSMKKIKYPIFSSNFSFIYLGVRGKVWKTAIGNELGLTYELFSQLEEMAREKLEATRQVK